MVQKAVRSEASSLNSLGPKRDWPEVRGEECRPRTVLSWLLANGSWARVRKQGVAHCHPMDLRTRRKMKFLFLEKVGTAAPRTSGGTETEDSPPGPPPDDLGAWLGRGGCRSPARGSTCRARYRFGLGRSSSGGCRRAPTATGRLRPGPGGSDGWCITPGQVCWIASVCCCTAENCWAKPSTVSPNSPAWEIGASRKCALSTSLISTRLSQRWRESRESGCQLTGLGRETRTVPPSGGVSWAQVHRDRSLHLG